MQFDKNKAIYLQIADLLMDGILNSKWNIGERIPSVREMATSIEVNPNTVMRAYNFLNEKEIIINKRGIGYSVCSTAVNNIIEIKKQDFLVHELPQLKKSMALLNISIEELMRMLSE